jgi:hypothetical protein
VSQGKVVWRNGQLEVTRGAGRNVARPPRPEVLKARDGTNERTRPNPWRGRRRRRFEWRAIIRLTRRAAAEVAPLERNVARRHDAREAGPRSGAPAATPPVSRAPQMERARLQPQRQRRAASAARILPMTPCTAADGQPTGTPAT